MGVSNKVMEALRAGILLNERVTTLIGLVKSSTGKDLLALTPH